jgi:hypothetical protein
MTYWIREFQNTESGERFRITSDIQYLLPLRRQIAKMRSDPTWEGDNVYKHERSLDVRLEGIYPKSNPTVEQI